MSTQALPLHSKGPELDPTDEKARRAVKAFRSLQPTLTSYARILTKRSDVRVEYAARDNGSTDGKKIYFRPPLALGDNTPHERRQCDKRDHELQLICPACRVREEVLVTIYHEIAHICYNSFAPPTEDDLIRTVEAALNAHGSKYAEALRAKIDAAPWAKKQSFKGIADLISPWMPMLVNALEDARVNAEQFKARTGTKIMFQANEWKIFNKGVEGVNPDTGKTEVRKWSEAPLNAQMLAGIYGKASGYEYADFFAPEVVAALDDEELTSLVRQIQTVRSAAGVYHISFPILARLRELGFCKSESDPQPEPEPEDESSDTGEESTDEQGSGDEDSRAQFDDADGTGTPPEEDGGGDDEGQVNDREEGAPTSSDEGNGESEVPSSDDEVRDSGGGSDEDEQPDGAGSDGSEEPPSEAQDRAGSDDERNAERDGEDSGEGADQDSPDDGNDQSNPQSGDDSDPHTDGNERDVQSEASEAGSGSSGDSEGNESESDSDLDGDEQPDGPSDQQADSGQGDEGSQPDRSGEDLDEDSDSQSQNEAGGDADSDSSDAGEAGEADSELGEPDDAEASDGSGDRTGDGTEGGGSPADAEATPPEAPPSDGAHGDGADAEASESGAGVPDVTSDEGDEPVGDEVQGSSDDLDPEPIDASADDGSEEGRPEEAIDTGADDGQGGVKVIEPEGEPLPMGDPDEVNIHLHEWMEHGEKPKEVQAQQAADEKAVDKAIIQGIYFETPSRNINGVREHYYDDPIYVEGVNTSMAWSHEQWESWHISRTRLGLDGNFDAPESILGPALLRMRVAFSENQRGKELRHLKSGKVDAKVLGKRAHHGDERMFRRRVLPGKRNYFVLIGVDVSGSTLGVNIALEKMAVMAQCQLLSRMGIQFAVFAHSGGYSNPRDMASGFDLEIYHIKDADEPWTPKVEERLREIGPDSANLDGHTLEFYRKYLDKVNATDKIIMYYTDGKMPAENHDEELEILQREIKMCKRKGYTLMAVGIRTDSPIRHGLDTVQVDEEKDVVKVVKHIEKRLLS